MSKEQIQVTVSEGTLTIKGETKAEEQQEEKNYLRREFHYGAFSRAVPLPVGMQGDRPPPSSRTVSWTFASRKARRHVKEIL